MIMLCLLYFTNVDSYTHLKGYSDFLVVMEFHKIKYCSRQIGY